MGSNASLFTERTCPACGNQFSIPTWRFKAGDGRTCSRRCNGILNSHLWNPHPSWSAEEKKLLKQLFADGLLDAEIGALLNRPAGGVHYQRARHGLKNYVPWSPTEVVMLRELSENFTPREIAALLGRTLHAVSRKIEKLGIKRPASYYVATGMPHFLYPPELREVIALQKQLRTKIKNEEHRSATRAPLQAA